MQKPEGGSDARWPALCDQDTMRETAKQNHERFIREVLPGIRAAFERLDSWHREHHRLLRLHLLHWYENDYQYR